ncbi:MAG: DegT/DnrJ/EryC1/StrS family aminotransferase [Thermoproteota archaeon]|nr:DegT/DnrJ/EryC1/StrS family aminotransferase [Candidatus Brockarchaeota archaeon]MBO3768569.1 DegT/DnrJ/EryC1/StrS family aminotransferase [Candidatus Brockarchaeota archaeon]MBO3800742.1 DegT/DnrJ/EryC1/StrS family aminotransferase [Candidatus Brockarchaeota archaeon]
MKDLSKLAFFGGKPASEQPIRPRPIIDEEEIKAVEEVLRSRNLSSLAGDKTKKFEEEFAKYIGTKFAIATSNGTTALHTALASAGVKAGDEVIVPPFTFVATATSVLHQDAIPVFADIDKETFTITPEDIKRKITQKTKAIIVVHLFGHPAEMDEIMEIAKEKNLIVIEDCAQAIGAEYKGKKVGSIGHISAFSFYATKNMMTGEGGMVLTNDEKIANKARLIRHHGQASTYHYEILGYNYRITEMQAAIGLVQLRKLETFNNIRRKHAKIYYDELKGIKGLELPVEKLYAKHVFHLYTIKLTEETKVSRDEFVKYLRAENVPAGVFYPTSLHLEPLFQNLYERGKGLDFYKNISYKVGDFPVSEDISRRVFSLYTDPILTDNEIITISSAVKKVISIVT